VALTFWHTDSAARRIYHLQQTGTIISSFSSPGLNPSGIATANDGESLWHSDPGTDLIYHLGLAGTILSSFSSPSAFPTGIAVAQNDTLWLCDRVSLLIYNLGLAGTILSSFSTPSSFPNGIAIANDGESLWHCDFNTDLIYHLGLAGTILSSFSSPSSIPSGIAIAQDETLYHCDANTDLIYRMYQTGTVISSFATPSGSPGGLVVAYPTTNQMLRRSKVDIFRKFSIKRRLDNGTGNYETNWQDLSSEVIKWGTIRWQTDAKKYNFFTQRGMSINVKNDKGLFNDENHFTSFWHGLDASTGSGFLTRYRTLVKIEAGFLDPDDNNIEIPHPSVLLYGYITENIRTGDNNRVTFNIKSLQGIFDEVPASKIDMAGIGSWTASDIIIKIRDMTDSAGSFVFQEFITSGAWNIETTTNIYDDLTTTTLDNFTCWGLIKKLAEAENKLVYVDRNKAFNFIGRTEGALTFKFIGHSLKPDPIYGHTIKSLKNYQQDIDLLFNRIRIKYGKEDTSTSYVTKEEPWLVGGNSTSWIYGVRTLEFSNEWMTDTTAEIIASTLLVDLNDIKIKCDFVTKFIPHLDLLDKVTVQYEPKELLATDFVWDTSKWDEAKWSGDNVYNFTNREFKIVNISHALDKMESNFTLREIT